MNIYNLLKNKQKKIKLSSSDEYKFYQKNENILSVQGLYIKKQDPENSFQLVVANIFIRSLMNKSAIENKVYELSQLFENKSLSKNEFKKEMESLLNTLPYIEYEETKIYVPIFSKSLNIIYEREMEKFFSYPYINLRDDFLDSIIDPLETYGYKLYDSFFTKLIKIGEGKSCAAFFSIDYLTIYIINNQGRLDVMIPLFDKYLKRVDTSNVLTRSQKVVEHYFNNDRDKFIEEMYLQKLISSKLYHKILRKSGKKK